MRDAILATAEALGAAAGVAEETFLETGRRLGASVELLEHLTGLFGSLQGELDGDAFRRATESLSAVAVRAGAIGGARRDERATLDRLIAVTAGLRRRIDEIAKEIRTIDVLTINARITASGIGDAGAEFLDYIGGIGRSLAITNTNLQHFRAELVEVGRHLASAAAGEADFSSRHAQTAVEVPRRLEASIALITTRSRNAAGAAADVGRRSRKLADGVGRVVMALQVGDATRQRIEHVIASAALLARVADARDDGGPWAGLAAEERRALAAAGCALQSAQLADAADEIAREIAAVHGSLGQLGHDAREIVRLGREVYGSAAHADDSFLSELEADVRRARDLFENFRTAREQADAIMSEVLRIAERLVGHIGTVRAVEADIRIMGVNATLKSSRLGTIGRPLAVVADELTRSSARTATEAVAAGADVRTIVDTTDALAGSRQAERLAEIAEVISQMDAALARLHGVADALAGALVALGRDGTAVVGLLDETAA
ncbi:hypothetical protein PQJ75_30630, partial [Rhodoplanes sp. TEM]|nr:hypothetical protein [Rhodoplanes sp. TEM]